MFSACTILPSERNGRRITGLRTVRLALGFGSNLGDRLTNLASARRWAKLHLHQQNAGPLLASSIYESSPVDCEEGVPLFYNAVMEIDCSLEPESILDLCQEQEIRAGRPARHGFHTPRTLDLDLLYYGDLEIHNSRLTLPHPAIAERIFVLAPLAEIVPEKILPGCPMGVRARLQEIPAGDSIRIATNSW